MWKWNRKERKNAPHLRIIWRPRRSRRWYQMIENNVFYFLDNKARSHSLKFYHISSSLFPSVNCDANHFVGYQYRWLCDNLNNFVQHIASTELVLRSIHRNSYVSHGYFFFFSFFQSSFSDVHLSISKNNEANWDRECSVVIYVCEFLNKIQ